MGSFLQIMIHLFLVEQTTERPKNRSDGFTGQLKKSVGFWSAKRQWVKNLYLFCRVFFEVLLKSFCSGKVTGSVICVKNEDFLDFHISIFYTNSASQPSRFNQQNKSLKGLILMVCPLRSQTPVSRLGKVYQVNFLKILQQQKIRASSNFSYSVVFSEKILRIFFLDSFRGGL